MYARNRYSEYSGGNSMHEVESRVGHNLTG